MSMHATRLIGPLTVVVMGLGGSIAHAQPAVQELQDFLKQERCGRERKKCLTEITNNACASGCVRKGYNWTADVDDHTTRPRPEPHMSAAYLKLLRDAAVEAPGRVLPDRLSFGYTLEQLLYHQTQVYLVDRSVRFYSEQRAPLSHAAVQSGTYGSNTVDPTRFWMVALGNDVGKPQAMGQGDFAIWLQSVAKSWAAEGRPEKVDYYLRLSQAAFRAFLVRHDEGGVRNNKRSYHCYADQDCYWFHSGNSEVAWPQSVLNKNLNAIRNLLWAHADLVKWGDRVKNDALPAGFPTNQYIRQLRDLGRGGLNQLAYGKRHAADHSAPPNLADFLQNHQQDPEHPSLERYNSWYRFDMPTHSPGNGNTSGNVCHYHYYTLQVFSQILTTITEYPYEHDPDFVALYYKLLYDRVAGDARTCDNPRVPPSKKRMRGLPLPELYYGGLVYKSWPTKSSFPHGHCNDALWFQLPDWYTKHPPVGADGPKARGVVDTRRFFDEAYKGCGF
jgi:hypothetical protein